MAITLIILGLGLVALGWAMVEDDHNGIRDYLGLGLALAGTLLIGGVILGGALTA